MFYALDGLDGSGKSTAAEGLAERMRSEGVDVRVRESPSDGPCGRMARRMLVKDGVLATACAAAFMFLDLFGTALLVRRCDNVIAVRYSLSALYIDHPVSGVLYRVLCWMLPVPDAVFLIDVDPRTALGRIGVRGDAAEMFENEESMERVRESMLSAPGNIIVIDGTRTREEVLDDIMGLTSWSGEPLPDLESL